MFSIFVWHYFPIIFKPSQFFFTNEDNAFTALLANDKIQKGTFQHSIKAPGLDFGPKPFQTYCPIISSNYFINKQK